MQPILRAALAGVALVGAAVLFGTAQAAESGPPTERGAGGPAVIEAGGFKVGFGGHHGFRGHHRHGFHPGHGFRGHFLHQPRRFPHVFHHPKRFHHRSFRHIHPHGRQFDRPGFIILGPRGNGFVP